MSCQPLHSAPQGYAAKAPLAKHQARQPPGRGRTRRHGDCHASIRIEICQERHFPKSQPTNHKEFIVGRYGMPASLAQPGGANSPVICRGFIAIRLRPETWKARPASTQACASCDFMLADNLGARYAPQDSGAARVGTTCFGRRRPWQVPCSLLSLLCCRFRCRPIGAGNGSSRKSIGGRTPKPRTVHELLGHADVRATMLYTHVLNRCPPGVRSPHGQLVTKDAMPIRPNCRTKRDHRMQDYCVQTLGRLPPPCSQACYADSQGFLGMLRGAV